MPDNDGEAQERVYHLQPFSHPLSLSIFTVPCGEEQASHFTEELNETFCSGSEIEVPPPNPGATDSMQPTQSSWTTPFQALRTSFCWEIWEVFACCSLPRSFPGGSVYRGTGTTTDFLGALVELGPQGPGETRGQTSEPTCSICLLIPASPASAAFDAEGQKTRTFEPNSHSPL